MRGRSFHATLTAAALLAGAATLAQAQDIDLFGGADTPTKTPAQPLRAAPAAVAPSLIVDPSDWAPGHPAQVQAQRQQDRDVTAGPAAKSLGLDPGAVVKPAVPAPAKDPLDTAKVDAGKTDAAKADTKSGADAPETKVAEAPLPPANAAIKVALEKLGTTDIRGLQAAERRKERAAIGAYYAARAYAPTWSADGAPVAAVEPVLARLARAGDDALTVPAVPTRLVATGTPDEVAASDIAMTEAVVAYARQASGARVDPRAISPLIGSRPELADPAKVLGSVAAAGVEAGDKLAALNPKDPRYAALREKLVSLHGSRVAAAAPIAPGPTLRIGMHDGRVPALRARLGVMASDLVADEDEYDMSIAEAVAVYQRGNRLSVTGKLDRATVAALSGGGRASPLEATLEANMEMWRWMPRDLGRDRIEVDVPAYTVTVFHDGEPVASNRVVVGKTDTPTPLFSNVMKYLIVNPVWNVPQSIIKKEMMAKIDAHGGTLRGFDVSYRNGQMVVKQPSGAKNALGQIKFIFPNDFSVYLHDTPSKSLFSASKRAFSHGCVRVDQPFDFAFSVLNDSVPEGGKILWSQKRLEKLVGDDERYVNLPKPLPIHIEYFTASVDAESGRIIQREDIYGYAHAVAAALSGEVRPAQVAGEIKHTAERAAAKAAAAKAAKTAAAKAAARTVAAKTAVAADEDPR